MEDVAQRAGVSRALVSLVMRGSPKVSDERRASVLKAAKDLGYRPNVLARNLASRRTNTIGVTVNDLHNPFFAEAVDGILEAAGAAGYHILLATGGPTTAGEADAVETFLRFRVDGLILVGARLPAGKITAAAKACPIVLLARTIRSRAVDAVISDEPVGAQLAVDHLVGLGHTSIAHIDGGDGAGARYRRGGYIAAMTAAGLESEIQIVPGDYTEAGGAAGAHALLGHSDRPPTAIFAANDLTALGAREQAEDLGLVVPDDLSVVGYDNLALAATHHLSLTTINQPREAMGRTAFGLLIERLDQQRTDGVRNVITPTLVERSSTARPPRKRRPIRDA